MCTRDKIKTPQQVKFIFWLLSRVHSKNKIKNNLIWVQLLEMAIQPVGYVFRD